MSNDCLRDGRTKNWFYLENDLLDREDLTIYEKTVYIVIARYLLHNQIGQYCKRNSPILQS